MSGKLCVVCRHFNLDGGTPNDSELTPGEQAEITCAKTRWEVHMRPWLEKRRTNIIVLEDMYTDDFRRIISTAETCPDYEEVTP